MGKQVDKNKSFSELYDDSLFKDFFQEQGLRFPNQLQKASALSLLKGEDVMLISPTGSGKTLSFALPLAQLLKSSEASIELSAGSPRAIVLAPTRELSHQLTQVFKSIAHHAKLRIRQLAHNSKKLKGQEFDLLIANPSSLKNALKNKELSLSHCSHMILDEADQLLEMGFKGEIETIYQYVSARQSTATQLVLVTATSPLDFSLEIQQVFSGREFKSIDLVGKSPLREIETFNVQMGESEKPRFLLEFFKTQGKGPGIIFVSKKERVGEVYDLLSKQLKRPVVALHGGMSAQERKKYYRQFREKKGILIASDIAARGIDIKEIAWVLNYDLPFHAVYYLHRAGRTGRAGQKGRVFNFVTTKDRSMIERINQAIVQQKVLKLGTLKSLASSHKKTVAKKVSSSSKKTKKQSVRKKVVAKKTPRYKRK